MSPNPKEAQTQNFFAFFSREFVNETLNPRTKQNHSFFLFDKRTDFLSCVFCVCVCI